MVQQSPSESSAPRSVPDRPHYSRPTGALVTRHRAASVLLALAFAIAALVGPSTAPVGAQAARPRDFFVAGVQDLNAFWTQIFSAERRTYVAPNVVRSNFQRASACPPGVIGPNDGPHYCPVDMTIFMPIKVGDFSIKFLLDKHGAVGVYYVLAHEWGHHVQRLVYGITSGSRGQELQADCLAGLYLRNLALRGILSLNNFQHTQHLIAADSGTSPATHGTSQQRYQAFYRGYSQYTLVACNINI